MNSWDCFDTLIARKHIHPKTVFDEVGRRIGDENFKQKRVAAEKASNGTYEDIYKRLPGIDPQVELDVELEHMFPITENMMRVREGDLILSDMYLPEEFVLKLLRHCGLTRSVRVKVTPNGKKKGWVWDTLQKHKINLHIGDNYKSDVLSAEKAGIKAEHYTGHKLNEIEQMVYKHDKQLAAWMRCIRLVNPFNSDRHIKFWNDQANINLPVLALATLELPDTPIAFTYRDCHIWHELYENMTGNIAYKLDVSRKMYLEPNKWFDGYIEFVKDQNATIVDLQGKGKSILTYYKGKPPKTVYIGGKTPDYIEQLVPYNTKSMEKHNCYDQGPVIDFDENGPIRDVNDHPADVADIHKKAKEAACRYVHGYKFKRNKELLLELVKLYDTHNFTNKNIHWAKFN